MPSMPERPSMFLVLSIVTGLPIVLWVYKCLMMVVFQRKIIYMGYVPLGSRAEELAGIASGTLKGLSCEEVCVDSEKNVTLRGIFLHPIGQGNPPKTILIYLQGTLRFIPWLSIRAAVTPLHRKCRESLASHPHFSKLLQPPPPHISSAGLRNLAVLAVAPRSYWKSTSRKPTQGGILADYYHVLKYALDRFPESNIVLYGHSLGGAAALCLLSRLREGEGGAEGLMDAEKHIWFDPRFKRIKGLVLENPFSSIPGMVRALYPEQWVPYRYLAPLAFDKWDAVGGENSTPDWAKYDVMVSENDEVVPKEMGQKLFQIGSRCGVTGERSSDGVGKEVIMRDALHENAWEKREWIAELGKYLDEVAH
ncbi:hypothetical protein BD779DRAFT_1677793 [Infundibulicybe gibba]|nr:hypothetical protein BD779DRAFT_1677793 [Infundibulicybe gibba]